MYPARASFLKLVWVDNSRSMLIERLSIVATVGLSPPLSPPIYRLIRRFRDAMLLGKVKLRRQ